LAARNAVIFPQTIAAAKMAAARSFDTARAARRLRMTATFIEFINRTPHQYNEARALALFWQEPGAPVMVLKPFGRSG